MSEASDQAYAGASGLSRALALALLVGLIGVQLHAPLTLQKEGGNPGPELQISIETLLAVACLGDGLAHGESL